MKKYHSKIDRWIMVILLATIFIMWLPMVSLLNGDQPVVLIVGLAGLFGIATWLIASILLNTYYWFEDDKVHWRTGPFRGNISISQITSVRRAKSLTDISAMVKPCLSSKPLLLRYSKYDDLPISPEEEKEFVDCLKKLKSDIEIAV